MAFDKYRDDRVCPIVGRIITAGECYDVHCVIDGAPEWTAPKDIRTIDGYKEKCLKCPMHIFED